MIESVSHYLQLWSDEDASKRRLVVTESAAVSTWIDLVESHPELCDDIALNKSLPVEILELLATNASENVRFTVAMKSSLSASLFQLLANDSSETVRARIAFNKRTPVSILRQLAKDPSKLVSDKAKSRLSED